MPSVILAALSEEQIEDLLYFSRTGQLEGLQNSINTFVEASKLSRFSIISTTVEEESGNSLLHMASANGHIDTLNYLISGIPSSLPESRASLLNLRNTSGNTALHWASLNGHLESVKILMAAGADAAVRNKAGHDALYEAEINSQDAVAEWLLTEKGELKTDVAYEEASFESAGNKGEEQESELEIAQGVEQLNV